MVRDGERMAKENDSMLEKEKVLRGKQETFQSYKMTGNEGKDKRSKRRRAPKKKGGGNVGVQAGEKNRYHYRGNAS